MPETRIPTVFSKYDVNPDIEIQQKKGRLVRHFKGIVKVPAESNEVMHSERKALDVFCWRRYCVKSNVVDV